MLDLYESLFLIIAMTLCPLAVHWAVWNTFGRKIIRENILPGVREAIIEMIRSDDEVNRELFTLFSKRVIIGGKDALTDIFLEAMVTPTTPGGIDTKLGQALKSAMSGEDNIKNLSAIIVETLSQPEMRKSIFRSIAGMRTRGKFDGSDVSNTLVNLIIEQLPALTTAISARMVAQNETAVEPQPRLTADKREQKIIQANKEQIEAESAIIDGESGEQLDNNYLRMKQQRIPRGPPRPNIDHWM